MPEASSAVTVDDVVEAVDRTGHEERGRIVTLLTSGHGSTHGNPNLMHTRCANDAPTNPPEMTSCSLRSTQGAMRLRSIHDPHVENGRNVGAAYDAPADVSASARAGRRRGRLRGVASSA